MSPVPRSAESRMWQGMGDAWTALSTMIAGIAVWGAVGFALDKVFGIAPVLMVIGVLVGNFAGVYLIYVRAVNAERDDGRRTQSGAQRRVKAP